MSEWKEIKLGVSIYTNQNTVGRDYPYANIKYLDTGSITEGKVEKYQNFVIDKAPSRAKRLVKVNDIIYSTVRPIHRHYGFITNPLNNLVVSTGFVVISCKEDELYPKFLYYFLSSDETVEYLHSIAEGSTSTYPSLKPSDIENLEITIPDDILEQKAIAEVLSSLDDKIDLLHRQNKTLEQMTETLFRQWFMEEAKEDWEEKTLGEVAVIKAGGDKPKVYSKIMTERCNTPIYSNGIDNEGLYGYTDFPRINIESITISARGTIGFICLRQEPYVPIVRLISIVPNEKYISSKYLYLWAKFQNISGTGTTQQQLTVPDFSRNNLILPPLEKMKEFTNYVNTFFTKIEFNKTQFRTLKKLRDTLLPKLMSGEVRIM